MNSRQPNLSSSVAPPVTTAAPAGPPRIDDELDLLGDLVPLAGARVLEAGCGAAALARALLRRFPTARVVGVEVDERQHRKNLAAPQERLTFIAGVAQALPFPSAGTPEADGGGFDLVMMLKSLHHVPAAAMAQALAEARRVLKPGGCLYVSEPVFDGDLNEIVRLFNDEEVVRAQAQAALDTALAAGGWTERRVVPFVTAVRFRDFDEFEQKLMRATFADHRIDDALLARTRAAFAPHLGADGALFVRPMHVRLLQKSG